MKSEKLLLEIGTEEIPARFLPQAEASIKLMAAYEIDKFRLGEPTYKSASTPRRIVLFLDGVNDKQEDRTEEVYGPPRHVAYNEDGSLSKAGEGFARAQGVDPSTLTVKPRDGKGEYIVAVVKEEGKPAKKVLPEMLKNIILRIPFPKSMRWGDGDIRFARPIHWIVALYGSDVVKFEIDGIKSGNKTRGHRFLAPRDFEIKKPENYVESLKKKFVIVDRAERVNTILADAKKLCRSISGKPYYASEDHPLIVADLVEYPQVVRGSFDKKYLELPDELLNSVMWGHQKYFAVVDKKEKLKNYFIIVSNTKKENADTVRRGAERVIRARFDDARFYYEEDRTRTLESRVEGLRKVTFHEKLGSLHDKTMRVKALAFSISEILDPSLKGSVGRAALLSKTDLTTGVVYEFPELQGTMGQYYAINDGENSEVAKALREQYLPAYSGGAVPEGDVGAIVGLADRMDNIAAFFSIGLKPTGSEDPFALRRQALAVIAILIEKGYGISVSRMLDAALAGLGGLRGPEGVDKEILEFISLRLEGLLVSEGHAADTVQSVIAFAACLPLNEMKGRIDAVEIFKSRPGYNDFLMAIKRVRNITPKGEVPSLDPGLLQTDEERLLNEALNGARAVGGMVKIGDYEGAMNKLLSLTSPINDFFDKVLVMDKDEKIKNNRLALLKDIWATAALVADFSKLAERQ